MMNPDNLSVERVSDELLKTECTQYGIQLWSLGRLTKNKQGKACYLCELPLRGVAYRPITNLSNRMKRICDRH